MRVILEGPDGVGKSTLAEYLCNHHGLEIKHSSSETKNDLDYHFSLIEEDNICLDRANLGEIVYPIIFNRPAKMNWADQITFMNKCMDEDIIYIIFYASNFNDLKNRLFSRGDTEQVLQNAEKINLSFTFLAKMFSEIYENVYALDISKESDQIYAFEKFIDRYEKELNNESK